MSPITDRTLLTPEEAAQILKISRYTLYKLIKCGDIPSTRIGGRKIRIDYDALRQYMHGDSLDNSSYGFNDVSQNAAKGFSYVGSHDLSIELLSQFLTGTSSFNFQTEYKGSMEGLIALFHREAQITGIHLWDEKSQEYNLTFVKHLLPAEKFILVNLVQRVQGWIVPPGNPSNINYWGDITKKGLRFVNRQKGSGTRLKIDQYLLENQIPAGKIQGYNREETTHLGVALKVANKEADLGIGIQYAAQKLGLGFVPLFRERFDLALLKETSERPEWQQIMTILNSAAFHRAIEQQVGYDTSLTGTIVYNN